MIIVFYNVFLIVVFFAAAKLLKNLYILYTVFGLFFHSPDNLMIFNSKGLLFQD